MKKMLVMTGIVMMGTLTPVQKAEAQTPILEIIKAAVIKAIKAADLKIQRLQNETIMLQNAQKALENTLTKLKLDNITEWVEKHRNLYKDYYEELYKVKNIITYYKRIKDISEKQVKIMEEYKWAWSLFKKDENFTADELEYMAKVYSGLLDQSVKNIDQISLVVNSFVTQMSDAKRLQIINSTADQVDANYYDLTKFNQEAILLSLQRSKAQKDLKEAKKIYGIN